MSRWIIQWSLEHRLLVIIAVIAVAIAGVFATQETQMDVFPDFAPPQVVILTDAPGFSPEDVATLVSFPIETALNGMSGIVTVRSSSILGLSTIVAVFDWTTDLNTARQAVAGRLRQLSVELPQGVKAPQMLPIASVIGRLLEFGLTSETVSPLELRALCDWDIRSRLLGVSGVASVVCVGGGVKQYQVFVSPERLRSYGLSLREVAEALEGSNLNIPGGVLTTEDQEYVVTGQGRIASVEDIEHAVIRLKGGVPITVGHVAKAKLGPALKRGDASLNGGTPLVLGAVTKAFGADTLTVTHQVEEILREVETTLPQGVTIHKSLFRQASFIEATIANLRLALIQGAAIVTAVLFLFFLSVSPSLITFLALPISLLMALIVLKLFNVGINAMTIGGMSVALGGVVDDAIIDVENVFRRLRENRQKPNREPTLTVIYKASLEIRASVVYATFITAVVFVPVFFLSGPEGRIFTPLGLSYIVAIFASLLVAFTQTPVLCSFFVTRGKVLERESATVVWMKRIYRRVLDWGLPRPKTIVGISLGLLLSALSIIPFLGRSFLPDFHEGNFIIAMTALPGTSLGESMRLGKKVQKILLTYPEVISVVQRVGMGEVGEEVSPVNFSEFDVTLEFKERDPDELLRAIREDLSKIPGVAVNVGQFIAHRMDEALSGVTAQIAVKIFGRDLAVLREKGEEIRAVMETIPGVTDLQSEPIFDVPQLAIKVDRRAAARYGLGAEDVLRYVEAGLKGLVVSQVIEGRKSFDLVVRLDQASTGNIEALKTLAVDTPTGAWVPLAQVAEITVDEGPYIINHVNAMQRFVVQSNIEGQNLHGIISKLRERVKNEVGLPPGYFVHYGGQFESQQRAQRIMISLGLVAIVTIFLLLYQAFGSTRAALLVMVNLPLALIGGVYAVLLTDQTLSVSSLIGLVAVFGIAARNGIILLTHYQHLIREEGKSLEEAVLQGSLDRLSPVLMTASVAALGLFPLVIGSPIGKELERPLAWVILGGLATSTFLNLVVVPTLVRRFGMGVVQRSP